MADPAADVTGLLKAWTGGDEAALAALTEQVYAELHRIAHRHMRAERKPDTLQTTALVNEAYLRLTNAAAVDWRDRAQFFAAAALLEVSPRTVRRDWDLAKAWLLRELRGEI